MNYFYIYDRYNKKLRFIVLAENKHDAFQKLSDTILNHGETSYPTVYQEDEFVIRQVDCVDGVIRL